MAPVTRSSRPRRKSSSSATARAAARRNSGGLIERPSNVSEDAMDIDGAAVFAPIATKQTEFPLRNMAERVGKEVEIFAEELDKFMQKTRRNTKTKHREVVSLVEKYRATADDTVTRLKRLHGPDLRKKFQYHWQTDGTSQLGIAAPADSPTTLPDLERWTAEMHTWDLFQRLLELDYPDMNFRDATTRKTENSRFTADNGIWDDFVQSSDIAKERLKVLQWLELTAEVTGSDVDVIEEELQRKSDKGTSLLFDGWMDTRERIKAEKRLRFWDTPADSGLPNIERSDSLGLLVTQLDPDSVTRQSRALEKPDEVFERAFWTICWEMLRRGYSMDRIREWCAEKNELARAFAIGAQAADPNTDQTPRLRWLWRQACSVASRNGLNDYERGVYGLLCGINKAVEPLCQSWSDFLYAEYNSRLLQQFESYLAAQLRSEVAKERWGKSRSGLFKQPTNYQQEADRLEAARDIAASLELNPASRVDGQDPFQRVQAALVAHNVVDLIFYQGVALARKAKDDIMVELKHPEAATLISAAEELPELTDDSDVLRVMTHIYLIYKELGVDFGEGQQLEAVENTLCAYIEYLLYAGKMHLIPLYASKLSSESAIIALARCLPQITTPREQQEFVTLMMQLGIDVPEVLTYQAHLAMWYSDTVDKADDPITKITLLEPTSDPKWPGFCLKAFEHQNTTASEQTLIRAMEWFLLVEGGWSRMFQALTEIAIAFLKSSRISAVLELFKRLPFSDISVAKKPTAFHQPVDILDDSDDDTYPPDPDNDTGTAPALRHSASLAFRSQQLSYKHFGSPRRLLNPEKTKVARALYKAHARTYFELGQLVEALRKLYACRAAEQAYLDLLGAAVAPTDPNALDAKRECRRRLDQLVQAMEPLLHAFLAHPSPCVEPPGVLQDLRRAFLPQMILAYCAALQCAGFLLSREHLLQCLDLATDVADNEVLIADFKAEGEMGTLVDAFAHASKSMLRLNEAHPKTVSKRRGRDKRTLAIWDVK